MDIHNDNYKMDILKARGNRDTLYSLLACKEYLDFIYNLVEMYWRKYGCSLPRDLLKDYVQEIVVLVCKNGLINVKSIDGLEGYISVICKNYVLRKLEIVNIENKLFDYMSDKIGDENGNCIEDMLIDPAANPEKKIGEELFVKNAIKLINELDIKSEYVIKSICKKGLKPSKIARDINNSKELKGIFGDKTQKSLEVEIGRIKEAFSIIYKIRKFKEMSGGSL